MKWVDALFKTKVLFSSLGMLTSLEYPFNYIDVAIMESVDGEITSAYFLPYFALSATTERLDFPLYMTAESLGRPLQTAERFRDQKESFMRKTCSGRHLDGLSL